MNAHGMEPRHQFQIDEIPVFSDVDSKWGGKEELILLDAIEFNGYGNWKLIAAQLSSESKNAFSPEEVKDHYETIYFSGKISEFTWKHGCLNSEEFPVIDHTTVEDVEILKIPDVRSYNFPAEFASKLEYLPIIETSRKDSDTDAENVIQDIDFNKYDDEIDREMNICLLNVYRRRLKARRHVKTMTKVRKLVEIVPELKDEVLKSPDLDKPENLEVREKLLGYVEALPLVPVLSATDFHTYYETHLKERSLKRKIDELLAEEDLIEEGSSDYTYEDNNDILIDNCEPGDDVNENISESKLKVRKFEHFTMEGGCRLSEIFRLVEDNETAENPITSLYEADSRDVSKIEKNMLDGWSFLSDNEKKLCDAFDLPPVCYVAYKVVLICANRDIEQGKSVESYNLHPSGLEKEQVKLIINFMSENGWIKAKNFKNLI